MTLFMTLAKIKGYMDALLGVYHNVLISGEDHIRLIDIALELEIMARKYNSKWFEPLDE